MMEHLYLCIDPAIWSHVYEFSGQFVNKNVQEQTLEKKCFAGRSAKNIAPEGKFMYCISL